MKRLILTAAVLATAGLTAASARADDWGRLYPSVTIASEYRYEGESYSNHEPVVQASIYWWRPDNFYAGVWATNVDLEDHPHTSIEVDMYAGRKFQLRGTQIAVETMYTDFPNKSAPGPSYNFFQTKITGTRQMGPWSGALLGSWSPAGSYGAGVTWLAQGDLGYNVSDRLKLSAQLGRRWVERGQDRTYWSVGATIRPIRHIALDVKYTQTNLNVVQCGFVDWCKPAVVGSLTYEFW